MYKILKMYLRPEEMEIPENKKADVISAILGFQPPIGGKNILVDINILSSVFWSVRREKPQGNVLETTAHKHDDDKQ